MKSTFWQILSNNIEGLAISRGIEIPILQRDYVQGRNNPDVIVIRNQFLNKIKEVIVGRLNNVKPDSLDLDFVYGYSMNEKFIPLDGQQRLTTLFLLHWYVLLKGGSLKKYTKELNRFKYQIRPTTEDFIQKIVNNFEIKDWSIFSNSSLLISDYIKQEHWYFERWNQDNSIMAMLTMIDDIHKMFRNINLEDADLLSIKNSPISFSFLDIEALGLSDELYIKMNARGKTLTSFENLKAELCRYIEESEFASKHVYNWPGKAAGMCMENYFATRIDTLWTDYFWKLRNEKNNSFDDKLLNVISHIGLNELAISNIETYEKERSLYNSEQIVPSFYQFKESALISETVIVDYIHYLDMLVATDTVAKNYLNDDTFINKSQLFEEFAFTKTFAPHYIQRIRFYAILNFYRIVKNQENAAVELKRFDRLLHNLTSSPYYYNTYHDLEKSLKGLNKLFLKYRGDIYETFVQLKNAGFDGQQSREEKLKIRLIQSSSKWENLILTAESHPYLKGQIGFLLALSGVVKRYDFDDDFFTFEKIDSLSKAFISYFEKFKMFFDGNGVKQYNNELFRVALLSINDYVVKHKNWCFINNGEYRDASWKRVLREIFETSDNYRNIVTAITVLFNQVKLDIPDVENLKSIIKQNPIDKKSWRYDFVRNPELIYYNESYYVSIDEGETDIHLLSKTKFSNRAIELQTYLISKELKKDGIESEIEFVYNYDRSAIVSVNGKRSTKIFYFLNDTNSQYQFLLKQRNLDDLIFSNRQEIVKYVIENQ